MLPLLIILILLFGGGGFYFGQPYYGGGIGFILLIVLIVLLLAEDCDVMGLGQTILSDVTSWAADAEKLATSAVPIVGDIEAALVAIGAVAKVVANFQAEQNTPAMQQASSAQKLLNFKARVDSDLVAGNEADLEKLEAGGPTP